MNILQWKGLHFYSEMYIFRYWYYILISVPFIEADILVAFLKNLVFMRKFRVILLQKVTKYWAYILFLLPPDTLLTSSIASLKHLCWKMVFHEDEEMLASFFCLKMLCYLKFKYPSLSSCPESHKKQVVLPAIRIA